jgi:hypothetical protein
VPLNGEGGGEAEAGTRARKPRLINTSVIAIINATIDGNCGKLILQNKQVYREFSQLGPDCGNVKFS